jgi:hypothetical protein
MAESGESDDREECEDENEEELKDYNYFWAKASADSERTPERIQPDAPQSGGNTGPGSKWNAAQTWEEKSLTSWFTERMRALLEGSQVHLSASDSGGLTSPQPLRVRELNKVSGDASVVVVRGKPRYGFDFSFDLKWALSLPLSQHADEADGEHNEREMLGQICVADVSRDSVSCDEFVMTDCSIDNQSDFGFDELRFARRHVMNRLRDRLNTHFQQLQHELKDRASEELGGEQVK